MRPTVLIILDGWGINEREEGNAIAKARTPIMDRLTRDYPSGRIFTSGEAVGLPQGQMGNSEVGHVNIGAGRVVYQDLTRIDKAIREGTLNKNGPINSAIDEAKRRGTALHIMGLLSDGGVHSHINHWFALIRLAKERGLNRLFLHPFLDGRDTPPTSGRGYIALLDKEIRRVGLGVIATIMGRYYAMDRDKRWDRVEKAYRAITLAEGQRGPNPGVAVERSYEEGATDEFVSPIVMEGYPGLKNGDAIIFINFRADRAREITRAFTEEGFREFPVLPQIKPSIYVCMTEYDEKFTLPIAFPPIQLRGIIGEVISQRGLRQLRIAETEKYAHVTFFLNGGREEVFEGEERILIPSPRDVPTYDLKPQMSAPEVTQEVVRRIRGGNYHLVILNYANPDMVGHTGVMEAAIKAVEVVDEYIGEVVAATLSQRGRVIITADHGNIEQMIDYDTKEPHTAHTTNPVPVILVDEEMKGVKLRDGILADITPTILALMNIPIPPEMEGKTLF